MDTHSRVATLSRGAGFLAVVACAVGPLAIQLGLLSAFIGFRLFLFGALLGLVALLLGAVGLWTTRSASGRIGRGRAVLGLVLGFAIVGVLVASAGSGGNVPAINDITTNPEDPPVFFAAVELEPNRGRDLTYPGEEFASQQRDAYPDLAPIVLAAPPSDAFPKVESAIEGLGWEITYRDAETGVLEAVDVTRIFRFVDDIVVRIRPQAAGSVIDVRSKSRDGKSDMGANATRIRAFRDAL